MRNLLLFYAVSAFAAAHSAFAVIDLTDWLRRKGADSYTVTISDGAEYNGMAKGAFDGNLTTDAGRALMNRGTAENRAAPAIELNVHLPDAPDKGLTVSSFRLYRIHSGSYYPFTRTTRNFALQASMDGNSWSTLYRTSEAQLWTEEIAYRNYDVPVGNRGCYQYYRIKMYPDYSTTSVEEDQNYVGFQELVLYGNVGSLKFWNGGEGEKWDSLTANWTNQSADAVASTWKDGVQANFTAISGDIVVDGEKQVDGIVFDAGASCRISGSRIKFFPNANILAGSNPVICNDICNTGVVMSAVHTGYHPKDESNSKQGARVCLWKNRNLHEMTLTGASIKYYTNILSAQPYFETETANGRTVQFQTKHTSENRFLIISVKILFEQECADVYGKVQWIKYVWDKLDVGHDIENDGIAGEIGSTFGVKDVTAIGGDGVPSLSFGCSMDTDRQYDNGLPQNAENPRTGSPVVYWRNRKVDDIVSITEGILYVHGGSRSSSVHYFTNDGTTANVQFQTLYDSARVCVKVEFVQSGNDISARAVYGKYDHANTEPHNYDSVTGAMDIRKVWKDENGKAHARGSSVGSFRAVFKGGVTLTGALEIAGDITVNENTVLTLGADALDLNNSYAGEGTVRFAAASGAAQTVTVTGVRTMGKVAVGGALRLVVEENASLSVADMSFEPEATLSVESQSGSSAIRIGTEKFLGADVLSKILINGNSVMQDEDGWLVRKPGLVITIQ